jgi:hypothetical protein
MTFAQELQDLHIFASEHLPPSRPANDPRGPLHSCEFGPKIHEFRHRAELFLLASGYFDKDAYEKQEIGLAMPDTVFEHLGNALLSWESKQSLPQGLPKKEKKEKLRGGL